MGMPRTLKDMMFFNEGESYQGDAKTVTLPTLTRKMEDWRGGGMSGPVKMDMGMEAMQMSFVTGGPRLQVLRQFGVATADGVYTRFVGNFQSDDTAAIDTIEIITRGRHSEIERGGQTPGEPTECTTTVELAYYKEVWNGRVEAEIDFINMIEIIGGIDRLAERRQRLGMF